MPTIRLLRLLRGQGRGHETALYYGPTDSRCHRNHLPAEQSGARPALVVDVLGLLAGAVDSAGHYWLGGSTVPCQSRLGYSSPADGGWGVVLDSAPGVPRLGEP